MSDQKDKNIIDPSVLTNLPYGAKIVPGLGQPTYAQCDPSLTATPIVNYNELVMVPNWGWCDHNGQTHFSFMQPEEKSKPTEKCKECNGSGKYVGLTKTENCKICNGTGTI